ncbi:MAG TPA: diacylglycerol kinase family protein [Candidatus Dormibacteraeota bacterium]|nr:diacylglycerol kinase family protein [Candidatus Dormibacteraeota bacterium]
MSVAKTETRATRLLVISRGAGSMNEEVEKKLRSAFADHLIVDFDPNEDIGKLVSSRARIIVAGGDGTVEFMVRKFADSLHPIGVISLGTFNNLARALGLPPKIEDAIQVARHGRARPITLGRVNNHVFVEACAIGLFGETIALGDSAKDLEFGQLAVRLRDVIAAKRFQYDLSGDIEGSGSAMSLVFSNTSSIGSQLPISDGTPIDPYLEFSVHAGESRTDIAIRAFKSALLMRHTEDGTGQVFKFSKLEVKTKPRVRVYADNFQVGLTPARISAYTSALKMLLPK